MVELWFANSLLNNNSFIPSKDLVFSLTAKLLAERLWPLCISFCLFYLYHHWRLLQIFHYLNRNQNEKFENLNYLPVWLNKKFDQRNTSFIKLLSPSIYLFYLNTILSLEYRRLQTRSLFNGILKIFFKYKNIFILMVCALIRGWNRK